MQEARRLGAAEQPAEGDLHRRGLHEVVAADHEIDPVAEVVDHDAQGVRPVAVLVLERRVTARRDGSGLGAVDEIRPRFRLAAKGRPQRDAGLVEREGQGGAPAGTARSGPGAPIR